jgi:hypothetical protein
VASSLSFSLVNDFFQKPGFRLLIGQHMNSRNGFAVLMVMLGDWHVCQHEPWAWPLKCCPLPRYIRCTAWCAMDLPNEHGAWDAAEVI